MTASTVSSDDKSQNATEKHQEDADDVVYPTYTNHNGLLMPKGFPIEGFQSGIKYQSQPNDLFVSTYPKCGTTWTQNIVYLILNNGEPLSKDKKLESFFPHLEEVGCDYVDQLPYMGLPECDQKYRTIKTHLPIEFTHISNDTKCIYVIRNPKDAAISFYYHTKGFVKHYGFANGKLDVYIDLFLKGQVDHGDYFECVTGWYNACRSKPNFLFLTYEKMNQNHREAVLQIADFMGSNYKDCLLKDNETLLNKVLEHSSFQSMSKDQVRWASERPGHTNFVRKGQIGDWRTTLSEEQSQRFNERIHQHFTEDQLIDIWGPNYKSILF